MRGERLNVIGFFSVGLNQKFTNRKYLRGCLFQGTLAKNLIKHFIDTIGVINTPILDIVHSFFVMGSLCDVINFGSRFLYPNRSHAYKHLASVLYL